MNIYDKLKEQLIKITKEENLALEDIEISSKVLTNEEAIGTTKRKDFPLLDGKEVMIEAKFKGAVGQAFTSSPSHFKGSLKEIIELDIVNNNYNKSLFIASLNAVMKYLQKADRTIHCKNEQPELCAQKFLNHLKDNYENSKILLIGFQPAILDHIKDDFKVRVLDLNKDNVGKIKYNTKVEDGIKAYDDAIKWADIVLCTGSTIANGSVVNFIDIGKPVFFYGTTIAGSAPILNLKRICFYGE